MFYCQNKTDPYWDEYDINKVECETTYKDVGKWVLRDYNFEDVFKGLLTLMVFVTLEAWPTLAFWIIDGPPDNALKMDGPHFEANKVQGMIFCVVFIFAGSFFFLNLAIGVIFDEFAHQ
jgi:hypothetical protein